MASRQITALDVTGALGTVVLQAANNLADVSSTLSALGNLGGAPAASPVLTGLVTNAGIEIETAHTTAAIVASGSASYPATSSLLILTGASATPFTLNLPTTATIMDGQVIHVTASVGTIAALTVTPAAGQTCNGAPTTISPATPFELQWIASLAMWVRR